MIADNDEPLEVLELEENLGDVEKPPELKPQKYVAEVQEVQQRVSQAGNKIYNVKFVIDPSEVPADIREHYEDGAVLYYNRLLVPRGKADRRALFAVRQFEEALGLDTNKTVIDPNEWMGRKARLNVRMGTYQGQSRAEIGSIDKAETAVRRAAPEVASERQSQGRPAARARR